MTRPRISQPRRLGSVLGRVLGDLGLDGAQAALRVRERWDEAVGAEAASHSQPIALRGDVLEVRVDSSVWSQQLQLRRPEILARLSREFGSDAPADLHFVVGYPPRP